MKKSLSSHTDLILLLLALTLSVPLLFENALEHSSPMGYAGLFTQMAEQIANANFKLPFESPFYGPGGIPFAYPPFGLYLLAIPIKLTGKYFIFLRFLPPLISLLSLVPLFYLTRELSGSALAGAVTVLLTATSPDLYGAHVWAAGIARAPAFLFALASLYFFARQLRAGSRLDLILAGIFVGLTLMSHLLYALFCVLWISWWTLFGKGHSLLIRIKDLVFSLLIGTLIASVWLVPTVVRHGFKIFFNAFDSHGGRASLSFWQDIQGTFNAFWGKLDPVTDQGIFLAIVLVGIIALLWRRNYTFVLFSFFITLVFPESARFVFLLGCMTAGMGLAILMDWCREISNGRLSPLIPTILLVAVLGVIWWNGYEVLSRSVPNLDGATLDLAEQVQASVPSNDTYLALIKQDEAEWLPFLFRREPLVSQWGSEWLGEYARQTYLMAQFRNCEREQDWSCVGRAIAETGKEPEYLITYVKDRRLEQRILDENQWNQVYINDRYILWSRK